MTDPIDIAELRRLGAAALEHDLSSAPVLGWIDAGMRAIPALLDEVERLRASVRKTDEELEHMVYRAELDVALDEVERLRGVVEDVRRALVRLSDDLGSEYDVSDIDGLIARLPRPDGADGSASSSH